MLTQVDTDNTASRPLVSVIMGAYNSAASLPGAIESILSQSYTHWEFIICDDCSTDDTYEVAARYAAAEPRIQLMRNTANMGSNLVLNRCLAAARGKYVAIMDSDDVSLPARLEQEVAFLEAHPQYALVGCAVRFFDEQGVFGVLRKKEEPALRDFAFSIPHMHASCMIRREAFTAIGGYGKHPRMVRVEDYYMIARLYAAGYRGYNLQEVLYLCCDNIAAYKRRTWQNRMNEVYTVSEASKLLKLPLYLRFTLLRPILVGLMPNFLYYFMHRRIRISQK